MLRSCFVLALLSVTLVAASPAHGAFPGRDGRVVFVRDGSIWSIRANGTGLRPVTDEVNAVIPGRWDAEPAVSPNGRWVAFTRFWTYLSPPRTIVYLARADGSSLRPGGTPERSVIADARDPAWFPDGKHLAVERSTRTEDGGTRVAIDVVTLGGDHVRTLYECFVPPPRDEDSNEYCLGRPSDPDVSPRGSRLAWTADVESDLGFDYYQEIAVVGSATGQSIITVQRRGDVTDSAPDWSPGGAWLAFTRLRGICTGNRCIGRRELTLARADGTGRPRVLAYMGTHRGGSRGFPAFVAWSPSGRRLVFSDRRKRLYTVRRDGTRRRFLALGSQPDWQPVPRLPPTPPAIPVD